MVFSNIYILSWVEFCSSHLHFKLKSLAYVQLLCKLNEPISSWNFEPELSCSWTQLICLIALFWKKKPVWWAICLLRGCGWGSLYPLWVFTCFFSKKTYKSSRSFCYPDIWSSPITYLSFQSTFLCDAPRCKMISHNHRYSISG